MHAVMEPAGFIAANAAQHCGTVEFCNKQGIGYGNNLARVHISFMDVVKITRHINECQTSWGR